jgi:hypothetical protein
MAVPDRKGIETIERFVVPKAGGNFADSPQTKKRGESNDTQIRELAKSGAIKG